MLPSLIISSSTRSKYKKIPNPIIRWNKIGGDHAENQADPIDQRR